MTLHHPIALQERFAVVECCLSLFGIVDHHHVQVQQGHVLFGGSLHNADAPVDIGRIAVFLIIGCGNGKVGTGIESLMADEHTVTERFPSKVFRGSKTTMMQEMALGINNIRIAVKDGGQVTLGTVPL